MGWDGMSVRHQPTNPKPLKSDPIVEDPIDDWVIRPNQRLGYQTQSTIGSSDPINHWVPDPINDLVSDPINDLVSDLINDRVIRPNQRSVYSSSLLFRTQSQPAVFTKKRQVHLYYWLHWVKV